MNLIGKLLIAPPVVKGNLWYKTVIMVTEHHRSGSIGLIINKRSPVTVNELGERLGLDIDLPGFVYIGGPISPKSLSIIHSNEPAQICVINPSVINVVKTIESPMAEYSKIIWRKMYDIANSVGMKYFNKYSIQSKKTGTTETARRYNFKKTSDFGATNNFLIYTISEDPNARYVFSIGYHLGDGTISCHIDMPDKMYIDVYSKRFDQHGYGRDYRLINMDDWEIAKKEIRCNCRKSY